VHRGPFLSWAFRSNRGNWASKHLYIQMLGFLWAYEAKLNLTPVVKHSLGLQ
jgi:hypothetical protein